jgi:hypothetical protein
LHTYRIKGLKGFYTGYPIHLTMDIIGTGCYFGIYETVKFLLRKDSQNVGAKASLISGGLAGALSWLIVFPADVVKSVLQKEALLQKPHYTKAAHVFATLYRERGLARFYQGIGPQLCRSFFVHALNFLVYEQVLAALK